MDKKLLAAFSILIVAVILTPIIAKNITKNDSGIKNTNKITENQTSQKISNIFPNENIKNNIFKKTEIIEELSISEKITKLFQNDPGEKIISSKTNSSTDEKNILTEELKDYGNQIGSVIKKYSPDSSKEIETFNTIITNPQNTGALADFKNISAKYKILAENLSLLKTPEKAAYIQPNLANNYKNIPIAIDEIIKNADKNDDFIKSLINYNEKVILLTKSISALSNLLKSNKIQYLPTEDGYIFTQY